MTQQVNESKSEEQYVKTKQIMKSFGYYEPFELSKLVLAIDTALEFSNEELSEKILDHVLEQIKDMETVMTSHINDIIEMYLLRNGHMAVLQKYIENRFQKLIDFTKKIEYLGNDLVSSPKFNKRELKDFDVNQIKIATTRYLLRDMETGKVNESMSEWFMRVARAVVLGSIVYDPVVYDKDNRQTVVIKSDYKYINTYFTESEINILERIHRKLDETGSMKFNYKDFLSHVFKLSCTERYQTLLKTYYDYMYQGIFEPNTPTLMNAGTKSGKCSACFTIEVHDTMKSIMNASSSASFIFQAAGGFGTNISYIRPNGANVGTTFGAATGPIALVLEMVNFITEKVKSGGKRRGANMGIMEYWHPDIDYFITMKRTPGFLENFNVSVMFDSAFWTYYNEKKEYDLKFGDKIYGKKNAYEFITAIAESAWASAEPGVLFSDNANKANPLKELRGDVKITNPCVTGNTRLNTEFGLITMKDLYIYDKPFMLGVDSIHPDTVHVGRGKAKNPPPIETKKASCVYRTADKAQVYRVTTEAGYELECTDYHPIVLKDGNPIQLRDIITHFNAGMDCFVALQSNVGLFGTEGDASVGSILGFAQNNYDLIKDLSDKNDNISLDKIIIAFDEAYQQRHYFDKPSVVLSHKQDVRELIRYMVPDRVPETIWRGTKDCVKMYLRMVFDVAPPGQCTFSNNVFIYRNPSTQYLKDIQLLLLNFGVITKVIDEQIIVPQTSFAHFLFKIGFKSSKSIRNLRFNKKEQHSIHYNSKIVKIEKLEQLQPVYDCEEYDSHKLILNGIVTGNCSEQYMYDGESCTLGSINLAKMINKFGDFDWEEYKRVIRNTTRFLNDVLEINVYPTEHIAEESNKSKRIGLGIMGLADCLYKLKYPYNSEEGYVFMSQLSAVLYEESVKTSIDLAEERGACEWYNKLIENKYQPLDSVRRVYSKLSEVTSLLGNEYCHKLAEYGIRNMWTTTVAPTGTISMIAGCSSGLEPTFALVFSKITKAGNYYYTNEEFKEALIREGIYSPELLQKVENNYGSCRGIKEIPKWIQDVFVTAMDMHWMDHVVAQAVWQDWIDNSISKTINMPINVTVRDVRNAYLLAHGVGLKGISIYRDGSRQEQVLHVGASVTSGSNVKDPLTTVTNEEPTKKVTLTVKPSDYAIEYIKDKLKDKKDILFDILESVNTKTVINNDSQETCPSCNIGVIIQKEGCNSCNACGFSSSCIVG